MKIEVLGSGCQRCDQLYSNALSALSSFGASSGIEVKKMKEMDYFMKMGVFVTPALVVDGRVISVSTGHAGGHGSMRLRPETVTLPDGSHFRLYAQLSGAPGSKDRIRNEGLVMPGSRLKKDGIEYGSVVSAGAVTGAILAGPGGALAGTIVGASVVSVHLLVNHPQATLEDGTVLLFTLSEPLNLVAATPSGN